MRPWRERTSGATAGRAVVLIRILAGCVFLSEGIPKLLLPELLAAGSSAHFGIPFPQVMGPFVGWVEMICGAMILLGLLSRLAGIFVFLDISGAIFSTKFPVQLGHGLWMFYVAKLGGYGIWSRSILQALCT